MGSKPSTADLAARVRRLEQTVEALVRGKPLSESLGQEALPATLKKPGSVQKAPCCPEADVQLLVLGPRKYNICRACHWRARVS